MVNYQAGDEFPVDGSSQNRAMNSKTSVKAKKNRGFHGFITAIQFLILGLVLNNYGWPLDPWTQSCLSFYSVILLTVWLSRRGRFNSIKNAVTILFLVSLFVPFETDWIQDIHGGREGTLARPWQLRFGRDGENTRLIESYLGPLKPEWRHRAIRSMAWTNWNDGNERVNSKSLIRTKRLPRILNLLPDHKAREQVLTCLTDSSNLLRVHQGLLLTALDAKGFPKGYDRASWWEAHKWIFKKEDDGLRAASLTQDWVERCRSYLPESEKGPYTDRIQSLASQIRGAEYQEMGRWGGDIKFGMGFMNLMALQNSEASHAKKCLARLDRDCDKKTIVWWP